MRGRGCRETHLASDGSSSASTSALVDETGRPRGLMTCMFAMELGARGGSGDETVAILEYNDGLDSVKRQWLWKPGLFDCLFHSFRLTVSGLPFPITMYALPPSVNGAKLPTVRTVRIQAFFRL